MFKKLIYTTFICSAVLLSGCGLETYQSGDLPSQKRLDIVKPGLSKEQVVRVLGEPALTNRVGGEDFSIYFQINKSSRAFMEPKETGRDIYVLTYNTDGILINMQHLTLEDGNNIAFDETTTKVTGKELSVVEQLVKNFGRYDAGGRDSTTRQ